MQFTIKQLNEDKSNLDSQVCIKGWVRTRRDSKAGLSFIHVSDGSCFAPIQAVVEKSLLNYDSEVLQLSAGCAIEVTGTLVASQGKEQSVEILAKEVKVVGWIDDPETYPIQPKHHSLEYLRDVAHLRPRTNVIGAVTRVRHAIAQSIHRFLNDEGFLWVNTPIITASDCEGAGELFRVSTLDLENLPRTEQKKVDFSQDFFNHEAYLTVSGQLNVEAYCLAMSKVYTFGPTFRAENSNTSRHLSEFWMIEPEIAFADLNDDINLAEKMLKHVIQSVLESNADDMDFFNQRIDKTCLERLQKIVTQNIERIEYREAVNILQKAKQKFEYSIEFGKDLQSEHERYLCEKHFEKPVAVMNYPRNIKAFYMRLNDDQETVAAMDILVPGVGEIIGGSQREERIHILDQRLDESGIDKDHLSWYRDLRRYGTVPHAGFGLGFERIISYITGLSNVRDVIPFPRTPGNIRY
ncbi:MAG: asparagine--tRNA ligase [Flavobacteriales bacterium]|nr:asparagine--tRNA ligase [Flavobacteriales bacterium]